jgi:hypothetical protein
MFFEDREIMTEEFSVSSSKKKSTTVHTHFWAVMVYTYKSFTATSFQRPTPTFSASWSNSAEN